ncbi:MAG: glycogen synthase [Hyphomicrobiales bacterium]
MAQRFRVAFLSAECVPFVKVGGLADVVGALSRAVADLGCSVAVFLPRYADLALPEEASLELVAQVDVPVAGEDQTALVYRLRHPAYPAHLHHFFLANETYFGRPGIYTDPATGAPFADDARRYAFFARACLEAMRAVAYAPEVIHANDHQTALVPAYLKTLYAEDPFFQMTASLLAIHNLGYQGIYPRSAMAAAGFPDAWFYPLSPFEFWGEMNHLKAGLHFADALVTVSERYAEEIQSGQEYGFGLQGVLNARRADLTGIVNGIDVKTWNPRTDRFLAARYDADSLDLKAACKAALLEEVGLPREPDRPLFGMISRLVDQKGLDLIAADAEALFRLPARWVFLGSGERRYEELLAAAARRAPDRIAVRRGFDEPLAHRIEGGADFFLMPSRYEPCGLNQMMSMRYGTVPVVRATGGLADTVIPLGSRDEEEPTGISFAAYDPASLALAVQAAIDLYGEPAALAAVRRSGMRRDFSWEASARKYLQLYRRTNATRRMGSGFNQWLESLEPGRGPGVPGGGGAP